MARVWYLIFATIVLLTFFRENLRHPFLGIDVGTFLGCGREILLGNRLYLEVWEINPPPICYISMIPLIVSNLSGLTVSMAINLFVCSMASLSMTLSWIALKVCDRRDQLVCLSALAFDFIGLSYCAPEDFAQREHLFIMAYLPFFFLRFVRYSDRNISLPLALAAGVFAGIGAIIKPYFALTAIAVDLTMAFQARRNDLRRSPEILAFWGVHLIYAIHFLFWNSQALHNFLFIHVPDVVNYYSYSDCSRSVVLTLQSIPNGPLKLLLGISGALLLLRQHRLFLPLLALMVISYLEFVYQSKGWTYQAIPMLTGVQLTIGALLVVALEKTFSKVAPVKRQKIFDRSCLVAQLVLLGTVCALTGLAATGAYPTRWMPIAPDLKPVDDIFATMTKPGDSVAVICNDGRRFDKLLLYHKLSWAWRYSYGYILQLIEYKGMLNAEGNLALNIDSEWQKLMNTIEEDIRDRQPKLLILDEVLRSKLIQYGALGRILSHYSQIKSLNLLGIEYDIYVRNP